MLTPHPSCENLASAESARQRGINELGAKAEAGIQSYRVLLSPLTLYVGDIDIEPCSECGGNVRIIASIKDPAVINKILAHLDQKAVTAGTALLPQCRAPPATGLFD